MKNYQWKKLKLVITASVMILAGVCYSCSLNDGRQDDILLLEETVKENAALIDTEVGEKLSGTNAAWDGAEEVNGTMDSAAQVRENIGVEEGTKAVCFVHICGAVECPGVYQLSEGSRIYQVVEMAGGFLPCADQNKINLAQVVADGMKVMILTEEEAETAAEGSIILYPEVNPSSSIRSGSDTLTKKPKININTAGKEELMTLRGIGESRAEDIIAYRERYGSFQKIEDIMKVSGIKDAAFEKIKEDITV